MIAPRTACVAGKREDGAWTLTVNDARTGSQRAVRARALVNAAGPWVGEVLNSTLRASAPASVRLVKGSHIVVDKLYAHDRCYIFQNADGRVFFAIPYENDFTLIGTTDLDYSGDPGAVAASGEEIDYLCSAASQYFRASVSKANVRWTYSGVRPLYDDGASEAKAATRDYVLKLDGGTGAPPLLTVYGGKITTYRKLAEAALAMLSPHLPPARRPAGWTAGEALPGGDFPVQGFDGLVADLCMQYPKIDPLRLRRLARAYGTLARDLLGAAKTDADLGPQFGAELTAAEVRHLVKTEWAATAEDVVWRRTKLGLRMSKADIAAVDAFLRPLVSGQGEAA